MSAVIGKIQKAKGSRRNDSVPVDYPVNTLMSAVDKKGRENAPIKKIPTKTMSE